MTAPLPPPAPRRLFRHLPAIYRAAGNDPFTAILDALEEGHDALDRRLDAVPNLFDPRSSAATRAALTPKAPPGDFLDMLARWVAIDSELPALAPGADDAAEAARRIRTLQHLVEQAAPLHATRGTVAGLRYLLGVLMDIDVQVLEWCWPAALQPGVSGQLGVDTLLTGEPPLERCVTLVVDNPKLRAAVAALASAPGATVLALPAGEARVGTLILHRTTGLAADPGLSGTLQQLEAVLALELPAHLARFVGFAVDGVAAPDGPTPFVAGVTATVGQTWILGEA